MTTKERDNLIEVKSKLGAKYRRKALNSSSRPKKRQATRRAQTFERQAEVLRNGGKP